MHRLASKSLAFAHSAAGLQPGADPSRHERSVAVPFPSCRYINPTAWMAYAAAADQLASDETSKRGAGAGRDAFACALASFALLPGAQLDRPLHFIAPPCCPLAWPRRCSQRW